MKITEQKTGQVSAASLQSLAQGSMFWRPDHVEQSPWLDHLPLMFWLMEAITPQRCVTLGAGPGSPHLAFCQGVQRLGLETECLLVATNQDEMADGLHARADRRYGALAGRLNVTPLRGSKQLRPGSVDILAVDVALDDEDLEDILERWLPCVSEKGLVLIPGINRREPGYLSHENFTELSQRYSSLTFHHGDGLGLLVVGSRPPELIRLLLSRWSAPTAARTVREVFARLGRACVDQALAEEQTSRLMDANAKLSELTQERDERTISVSQMSAQRKELEETLRSVESDKLHLAEQLADAQGAAHSLQTELAQLQAQLSEKGAALHAAEHRSRGLEAQVAERDRNIQTRFEEIATLTQMSEAATAERDQLQTDHAALEARLTEVIANLTQAESEKMRLEGVIAERDENIQTRFRELATMTNIAEEADRQKEYYKQKASIYSQRNEDKKLQMKELRKLRDQLSRQLESRASITVSEKQELEAELQRNRDALERVQEESQQKEAQNNEVISHLESRMAEASDAQKTSQRDVRELKKLLKKREKSLASRFDELGDLTAAMEEKDRELQSLREQLNPTPTTGQPRARKSGFAGARLPLPGLGAKSEKRREQLRQRKRQQETIAEIESSELFDGQWYLKQYPDITGDADYASNPALHYLKFGGFEGRNPSPHFDSVGYLEAYPDVALTGINPLLHYIRDGIKEGREPRPQ